MRKRRLPGRKLRDIEVRAVERIFKLPLRVIDRTDHSSRPDLRYAIIVEEPCEVNVEDSDVNECIRKAQKVIADRLAIEWKDVLHVSIGQAEEPIQIFDDDLPPIDDCKRTHGFELRWKRKQIGMRGDEPCYRERKDRGNSHIWSGELDVGPTDEAFVRDSIVYSVIDDTEANRAALSHIADMLDMLQRRLNEVLDPKTIQTTLLEVQDRLPLLLAVKDEPPKKVGKKVAKKKARRRRS